ncbi:hypothetical protein DFA_01540 [Cavenderia fasciculata]|uniref:BP74 N-terminal domain-containing protein n=1 Tax=Cavenderia fasciculata TaxID=261658 RepID=F4PTD2_CACFS|nr:uncharacterized protein DFA_01540 [Cavenderia fasciculata]EGG21654.1 hypothetical protein DFA_01540 [Cavenderia fasciculata]|eukprot:XP_004359504.1 hypothetical protein DFA_01540 [Cavenderia fasciculata]
MKMNNYAYFPIAAPFAFRTHGSSHDFVFKLTDVKMIEHARKVLKDQEVHVMGRIRKSQTDYNPHFSFHLDPNTITFFSMAIEVCDATLTYTEENLDEACGAFLPGSSGSSAQPTSDSTTATSGSNSGQTFASGSAAQPTSGSITATSA